ncbi:MAG: hypothetical protein Q3W91_06010 [Senegalimassilia sp.]|uniref:hypothetical protein n=1 Tax=Senegalimassilia sp. TaxID=1922200 RepID=UPI00284A22B7|nr:hypothetical protein [Senegalimassilia sp.]MDR4054456.1 hypothetical protein [Senegalimassilia sp.]
MCENMDEAEQSLRGEKLSAEQHGEASLAEKDSIAAEAGYKLGMLSYEAEMSRYDSLISATSHLMTFVSIESIALVTLLATLLEHSSLPPCLIAIWYLIIFALLIATFCDCIQESYAFVRSRNDKISKLVSFANALALSNLVAVAASAISLLSTIPFLT